MSKPPPPTRLSAPKPPVMKSASSPPTSVSLPPPPVSVSVPVPPSMKSAPSVVSVPEALSKPSRISLPRSRRWIAPSPATVSLPPSASGVVADRSPKAACRCRAAARIAVVAALVPRLVSLPPWTAVRRCRQQVSLPSAGRRACRFRAPVVAAACPARAGEGVSRQVLAPADQRTRTSSLLRKQVTPGRPGREGVWKRQAPARANSGGTNNVNVGRGCAGGARRWSPGRPGLPPDGRRAAAREGRRGARDGVRPAAAVAAGRTA